MRTKINRVVLLTDDAYGNAAFMLHVSDVFDGIIRNVDEDGVITFSEGERDSLRFSPAALIRQLCENIDESFAPLVAEKLATLREAGDYEQALSAFMRQVLVGATADITAERHETEDGHTVYFYNMSNIQLAKTAALRLAVEYCQGLGITGAEAIAAAKDIFGL